MSGDIKVSTESKSLDDELFLVVFMSPFEALMIIGKD